MLAEVSETEAGSLFEKLVWQCQRGVRVSPPPKGDFTDSLRVVKGWFLSLCESMLFNTLSSCHPKLSPVLGPHKMGDYTSFSSGMSVYLNDNAISNYWWWVTLTEGLGGAGRSHNTLSPHARGRWSLPQPLCEKTAREYNDKPQFP